MSNEKEIQAAEKQVHETGMDLDAAQQAHDSAEGRLRGAMRAWLRRITGPIEPVGSRTVRRSVPLSDLPEYLADNDASWALRGICGDRMYVTNGHLLIDVESIDGLERIDANANHHIGTRQERLVRVDAPIEVSETLTLRSFVTIAASARYTTIVEDLFPGVEWWCASLAGGHQLHAVVDGHLVAVVMPIRQDLFEASHEATA